MSQVTLAHTGARANLFAFDNTNNRLIYFINTGTFKEFYDKTALDALFATKQNANAFLTAINQNLTTTSSVQFGSSKLSSLVSTTTTSNSNWLFIGSHPMTDAGESYVFDVTVYGGDSYENGSVRFHFDSFGKNASSTTYGISRVASNWKNANNEIYSNLEFRAFRKDSDNSFEIYVRGTNVDYFHLSADVKVLKPANGLYSNYITSTSTIPSTGYTQLTITAREAPVRQLIDKIFLRNFSLARDTAFSFSDNSHCGQIEYDGTMFNFRQKVELADSTTSASSLKIKTGVAPTSPGSGDIWFDGSYLYLRNGSGTRNLVITQGLTSNYLPKASSTGAILADTQITDDGTTVNIGNGTVTSPKLNLQHNSGAAGGSEITLNGAGGASDSNSGKLNWGTGFRLIGTTEPKWKFQRNNGTWNTVFETSSAGTSSLDLTFYGALLLNTITANKVLVSNSLKQIVSSAVSDTELTYLAGVTSAIQTQLNGKQATLTNPVTGTGANTQLAIWNGTTTQTGSNWLTYDDGSKILTIGTNNSSNPRIAITATSGSKRFVKIQTGTSDRWEFGGGGLTESGSNSGTPFQINSFDDSGVAIDTPISIIRAAGGNITLARPLSTTSINATSDITFSNDTTGISLFGGGKYYKKSGTGLVLRMSSGDVRPQVENNAGTIVGTIWDSGNLTNLNQLTNGPAFVSLSSLIAGYSATSGTLSTSDSIISAINKLGYDKHVAVTIGTANGLSLATQTISLALASTSTTGALSSTDWNTFNGKANANNAALTGTPTAPTASTGTNTTQIATTAFVQSQINSRLLVPSVLTANIATTNTKVCSVTIPANTISQGSGVANTVEISFSGYNDSAGIGQTFELRIGSTVLATLVGSTTYLSAFYMKTKLVCMNSSQAFAFATEKYSVSAGLAVANNGTVFDPTVSNEISIWALSSSGTSNAKAFLTATVS